MPAPANDLCSSATAISSLPYALTAYDVTGATTSVGDPEPSIVGAPVFNTAWWTWTADSDRLLTINTTATNFDNAVSVWTGSCGALTEVASGWGGPGGSLDTQLVFRPATGTTYYLMVS